MLASNTMNQIKEVLHTGIKNGDVAGANMLVIKDGQESLYHEDGLADIASNRPIKRDTLFRLYSMTKPITAAAVMILLEGGQIDLFDPVCQYIPGFIGQKVDAYGQLIPVMRDVTIKDLLSMTSGLVYPNDENLAGEATLELFQEIDQKLLGEKALSTLEIANRLGQCPLTFQPGTSWQYGTSADVLGAIVEVVSGQKFGRFLEQKIFEPLGMRDTGFWLPQEKRNRLATAYEMTNKNDRFPYEGNHLGIINAMDRQPAFESGGAGLVSTIDDYARFAQMLMNRGSLDNVQILKPKTVNYLTSSTLQAEQQENFDLWHTLSGHSFGNLMRVMTDHRQAGLLGSNGEYGWDGWLGAYFCNCPEDNLTILIMMQKKDAGTTSLTRKLRNTVYASL
jgi:CubicO group peptidase (beta-lactamase class C family)